MSANYDTLLAAQQQLKESLPELPQAAIVLGTGLSQLAERVERPVKIPYASIPGMPETTAPGHGNAFYFGYLEKVPVLMMSGRFHYYEGYSLDQVVFPIQLLCMFQTHFLWISNAAGSVNPQFQEGDIVIIEDHINMMGGSPLRGENDERLGPRFPDMLHTYSHQMNQEALQMAQKLNINAHTGVYWAWQGPSLETPAEYEFIHRSGADVVGMSTVPEVIAARHMGQKVMVSSVVSNVCYPKEAIRETSVEDVLEVVGKSAVQLERLVIELCKQWIPSP